MEQHLSGGLYGQRHQPLASRRLAPFDWLALAWLGVGVLSAINVWQWPAFWQDLIDLVMVPLLLYGAVRVFCPRAAEQRQVIVVLFLGGLLTAIVGLSFWLQGGGTNADGIRRLVGPHFSPNHTALYLVRTLFVGVGLMLMGKWGMGSTGVGSGGWGVSGWFIGVMVVGGALLLTASRGALLLGVPMGGVVLLWLRMKPLRIHAHPVMGNVLKHVKSYRGVLAFIGLVMLVMGIVSVGGPLFGARLANSGTVIRRLAIWSASLDLWWDFPVVGAGLGGFFWRFPAYIPMGAAVDHNLLHPHNVWLEMAGIGGVIGVGWLASAILMVLKRWRDGEVGTQAGNYLNASLLAGLAAGFAHGQVDAFAVLPDIAAWNWVVMGLLAVRCQRIQGAD